ncbi:MAG TPA: 40S ribosomal protein S19, partial [Thermoplasmata archaeon]|nr:40S ribosomal protein S19 [Thermoplasmata archaeon]
QQAPSVPDWWYLRSASVLRKIGRGRPVGISCLASEYGGKRDRGSAPYHARKGSRAALREIVQQLEAAGLVQAFRNRGRRVTAEGQRLLDRIARETLQELASKRPELAKYL